MSEKRKPSPKRLAVFGAGTAVLFLVGDVIVDVWTYGISKKLGVLPIAFELIFFGTCCILLGALAGWLMGCVLYGVRDRFLGQQRNAEAESPTEHQPA